MFDSTFDRALGKVVFGSTEISSLAVIDFFRFYPAEVDLLTDAVLMPIEGRKIHSFLAFIRTGSECQSNRVTKIFLVE